MGYMDQYKYWKEDAYFDDATKAELAAIEGNEAEIEDRLRILNSVPGVCAVLSEQAPTG